MISPDQLQCVIEPIDMRRGIDGLSQWIQISLGKTPCDGVAYAFRNRAKSERAGIRAASIQTLLATAKADGIEPFAWFKETLEKPPTCPNSQIDDLLPLRY